MTAKKSTKTNKATNHDAPQAPAQEMDTTTPDQDKTTPTAEDTAAEASTPEPAANPGPNMTSHDYDALHGPAKTLEPYVASLRPIPAGLTPLQHVTAIIAGGVVGGMLARSRPYETLDLTKVAETIGMCAQLADLILDLEDSPEDTPAIN